MSAVKIEIDARTAAMIQQQVAEGRYPSTDEVVREAMRQLTERDRLADLRASLEEARAQFDRGEYVVWSSELMDKLEREADEIVRREEAVQPDART